MATSYFIDLTNDPLRRRIIFSTQSSRMIPKVKELMNYAAEHWALTREPEPPRTGTYGLVFEEEPDFYELLEILIRDGWHIVHHISREEDVEQLLLTKTFGQLQSMYVEQDGVMVWKEGEYVEYE